MTRVVGCDYEPLYPQRREPTKKTVLTGEGDVCLVALLQILQATSFLGGITMWFRGWFHGEEVPGNLGDPRGLLGKMREYWG